MGLGQPTKCTPDIIRDISELVRTTQHSFHQAALQCGISSSAHKNWMVRGRNGDEPYKTYVAALNKAKAARIASRRKMIQDLADGTMQRKKVVRRTGPNGASEEITEWEGYDLKALQWLDERECGPVRFTDEQLASAVAKALEEKGAEFAQLLQKAIKAPDTAGDSSTQGPE